MVSLVRDLWSFKKVPMRTGTSFLVNRNDPAQNLRSRSVRPAPKLEFWVYFGKAILILLQKRKQILIFMRLTLTKRAFIFTLKKKKSSF